MRTPVHRPTVAGLIAATLTAVALLLLPAAPAAAHNTLRTATPAKNAQLSESPKQITLEFMQKLNPAFTTITLSESAQQRMATSEPAVSGTKGTVTIDQPLPNGTYTVAYRVVSADGHPVQGSYRFTVADPAAAASPKATTPVTATSAAAPPTASASPASSALPSADGSRTITLIGGGVVLAAIIAGGAVVLTRRRAGQSS
jgi:methionine-rich copper-binding protein CopC